MTTPEQNPEALNDLDTDRAFLCWLHTRLEHVHGEHPCTSHMHRLRKIIANIYGGNKSHRSFSGNSLEDLLAEMDRKPYLYFDAP